MNRETAMGTLLLVAFLMTPAPTSEWPRWDDVGAPAIVALSSDLVRWCREMKLRWAEAYRLQAHPHDAADDCQTWIEACEGGGSR